MHVLLVLSLADARPAAGLVQVAGLSVARGARAAALLAEMGADPRDVEIRVWDSSAEVRYLVLPERPPGTEDLAEDGLAAVVTAIR